MDKTVVAISRGTVGARRQHLAFAVCGRHFFRATMRKTAGLMERIRASQTAVEILLQGPTRR